MVLNDLSTVLLSKTTDPLGGTTRWMSPELLDPDRFGSDGLPSRESDSYALGMTVYEVSDLHSFWSHPIYLSPGTQRPFTVPSPAVSTRSRMCNTRRGATEGASGRLVSRLH